MSEQVEGWTGPPGRRRAYTVSESLGSGGGQGFLFRAEATGDELDGGAAGQPVALKQFMTGAVGTDRIEELGNAVASVRHPYFVRQLEVFRGPAPSTDPEGDQDDDLLYVASLWVTGRTLDDAAAGAPVSEILTWIRQVAEVLDVIHTEQVGSEPLLHRDVKPSNIIIDEGGDAVLIDPGLARPLESGATATPYGSPGYVPPEADRPDGMTGPASDRWQLGATLCAALTGEPPVRTLSRSELSERLHRRVDGDVGDPDRFVDVVLEMLDPDPEARPSSAASWAADLWAAATAPSGGSRRRTWWLVAAAAVVVVAAFGLGWALGGGSDDKVEVVTAQSSTGLLGNAREVAVFNKVTSGQEMVEDSPGYLSTVPANFCRRDGCMLADTDLATGDKVTIVCRTLGARNTNGNDSDPGDDANPGLYESTVWYGVVLPDERTGYISDVWLEPDARGGLGLPLC